MQSDQSKTAVPVKYPNCAGIDVGKKELFVAVSPRVAAEPVRSFPTVTAGLKAIVRWLQACQVEHVAMEATGVYWIPIDELLEQSGFTVRLADPRRTKRPDRKKTDVQDCQWIRQLMSFGFLEGAYRTPEDFLALRSYVRQRARLIRGRSRQVLPRQKALTQMNVQLSNFLSDIMGQSGSAILRAIVAGERDPEVLASLCSSRVKASPEQLAASLEGNWRAEHRHELAVALRYYDFIVQEIEQLEQQIHQQLLRLGLAAKKADANEADTPTPPRTLQKPGKNAAERQIQFRLWEIVGVDLTAIEGVGIETALLMVAELGGEVSAFPTVGHFCSWLGLAPNNQFSGTSLQRSKPRQANRLGQAFRQGAVTIRRADTWLGAKHRRRLARMEKAKAVKATAHELARIVYAMINNGAEYVKRTLKVYEREHHQRKLNNLTRQAKAMGLQLVPGDLEIAAT